MAIGFKAGLDEPVYRKSMRSAKPTSHALLFTLLFCILELGFVFIGRSDVTTVQFLGAGLFFACSSIPMVNLAS